MDIKVAALGVLVSAFLLWGPVFSPVVAKESVPEDANTPTHASNAIDDERVTQQIRSAIEADESVSAQSRNIAIATNQQAVILRGTVVSSTKDRIEALAAQYAGARQVESQLMVKDY